MKQLQEKIQGFSNKSAEAMKIGNVGLTIAKHFILHIVLYM